MLLAGQGQDEADKSGLCDAIGTNELEATAEKCSVLKDILLGLEDKRTVLEQQTMEFEEETTKRAAELRCKEERLNEGKSVGE
ncbi:unnamed protein product [Phytophthora lilii]|uniref:Unnamed protein product n=1 Tax=Phytophthora lilii TaxID=2077276 RepID=A0A9W6YIV8_9STRA|nr:unnamed protein product [Phytophthora lilii]